MKSEEHNFKPHVHYISGTPYVLIQIQAARGLYIKTHVCVAHVACPVCHALRCQPCVGKNGFWHQDTHFKRRDLHAKNRKNKQ